MATRKKAAPGGSEFRFVKLVEDWCDHRKAVEAGDAACGAWSRILSHTARSMRAYVPADQALHFAFYKQSNLDRLVEVGLLEREGSGYRMHEWEIWQAELHEIVESKRKTLERNSKGGKAKAKKAAQAAARQEQAGLGRIRQEQAGLGRIRQAAKTAEAAVIAGDVGGFQKRQTETKTERKTEIETDLSGSALDCSRQGPTEIQNQNAPAPLDAGHSNPVSDYGAFDPKRSWTVTVEVWRKAGPYKGDGGEGDLSSAHRKFDEKISEKNWAAFARVLDWSVGRAIETRNRQMLGVLYRFIDVNWEKKEPFDAPDLPPLVAAPDPEVVINYCPPVDI